MKNFWQHSVAGGRKVVPALLIAMLLLVSCGKDADEPDPTPPPTPTPTVEYLTFLTSSASGLKIEKSADTVYTITTTNKDPYISTNALKKKNQDDAVVFTFDYQSTKNLSSVQIYFSPINESRSVKTAAVGSSARWKTWSVNVSQQLKNYKWGAAGGFLRLDFGEESGVVIKVKNMRFREMTDAEKKAQQEEEEKQKTEQAIEDGLKSYLNSLYAYDRGFDVSAGANTITVKGNYTGAGTYSLCEIPPYVDVLQTKKFQFRTPLTSPSFTETLDRFVVRDGIKYDRTLSKWAIVKDGETQDELVSHARYATAITATQQLPEMKPTSKKGLGGFHWNPSIQSDVDDLGITSATINVDLIAHTSLSPNGGYAHEYGGKTYYFGRTAVDNYDRTLQFLQQRNVVVAAIILIPSGMGGSDIGKLMIHPDYTTGPYSMPNMTTPESVNCYGALLDFLASRYCQTGSPYGRIHHWIMHNEVDAGIYWTNMGRKMITTYTDAYMKSMRMCYNIARQYDPNTEVFGSFTHSWTSADVGNGYYASLDMLTLLRKYSTVEGDFQWAVAYHPYPEDLTEPKTWKDVNATFDMKTPLVTFKNLEVLSVWAKKTENKYTVNGRSVKRSVWLSENGTNSRSYSEQSQKEQAAGFTYAWKKLKALDGIDAMQWHNWADNRLEDGLRIGLRKFSDEEGDPYGKKKVWYAYQAAGTSDESSVFDPYLTVINIPDWNIIQPVRNQ